MKEETLLISEVREALLTPIRNIENRLAQIPSEAKPRGEGVFELTLHPTYLAKSYYPANLLSAIGLRDVGSKEKTIVPRKVTEARLAGKPSLDRITFCRWKCSGNWQVPRVLDELGNISSRSK